MNVEIKCLRCSQEIAQGERCALIFPPMLKGGGAPTESLMLCAKCWEFVAQICAIHHSHKR